MTVLAAELYPAVTRFDYPERFVAAASAAPSVRERAIEDSQRIWSLVEANVDAPHAVGGAFSALDVQIAAMSRWRNGPREWVDAHCPKVAAITRAVADRPKVGAVMRRHYGHRL
jgi:GST-like protein